MEIAIANSFGLKGMAEAKAALKAKGIIQLKLI
jgi:hypothetical protein